MFKFHLFPTHLRDTWRNDDVITTSKRRRDVFLCVIIHTTIDMCCLHWVMLLPINTCLWRFHCTRVITYANNGMTDEIISFTWFISRPSLHNYLNHSAWWRHQMETFSALLAFCAGNSPVNGEFPAQRPVTRTFDVFFDLRLNKRLSKQSWGWWFETPPRSLWRHRDGAWPRNDKHCPRCIWDFMGFKINSIAKKWIAVKMFMFTLEANDCLHIYMSIYRHIFNEKNLGLL